VSPEVLNVNALNAKMPSKGAKSKLYESGHALLVTNVTILVVGTAVRSHSVSLHL